MEKLLPRRGRRLAAWLGAAALVWSLAAPSALADGVRRVTILYTGFTGGLSSGSVGFSELHPLFDGAATPELAVGEVFQENVFRHGDYFLYTAHGPLKLSDFREFFSQGPIELAPNGPINVIASDHAYLLQSDTGDWLTRWLDETLGEDGGYPDARLQSALGFTVTNRSGLKLSLLSLAGAPPISLLESPSRWEMVPARAVRAQKEQRGGQLLAIGRPLGDGLRRAHLLQQLRDGHTEPVLTVDVGNLVDPGHSALSEQQRAFTLLQLGTLKYDALVPAETELALDPIEWAQLAERVPLVAANLEPQEEGLAPLPPVLIKQVGGVKLALVGLVDDETLVHHGLAGPRARWKVGEPQAAARKVVAALAQERPDAVIVLTNIRGPRLQELRHLQGVSAVIGDFQGLPGEVYREAVALEGAARLRTQTPHLVARSSPNRVGMLTARFGEQPDGRLALERLDGAAHLVTDRLSSDEAWRWQLNLTLDRYQDERWQFMLPDLRTLIRHRSRYRHPDKALPALNEALWSRLVANVTRASTGAEVAVIRRLPPRSWAFGPLSQLTLESWLEVGDRLVQTTLSGKALKDLASRDQDAGILAFSGFDPATNKVMGVSLVDDELYRVTTTDMVARHARFEPAFAGRPLSERWLRHPQGWARPYTEGERTELRELAIGALKALKARHGGAFSPAFLDEYATLLATNDQLQQTRWRLSLEDGHLLVNSYQARNNEAFQEVRNTRVTTPSSFALGGRGKLVSVYESPQLAWENRAKAIYKRATLQKEGVEVTQETDDEVVLTSEFRLKTLEIPLRDQPMPLLPFVNTNYITQFTPDEADGRLKPRRQELNAVSGLVIYPGNGLKELRAGAVLKNDIANPGFLEPGLQAFALYEQKLDPWLPGTFKAGFDVTHYFDTPTDTPDRLGLLADLTAALTIPIWDRFNFSVSADYFVFRGKVPATAVFGSSLDFKVGVGYSLGFKPFYGVWF